MSKQRDVDLIIMHLRELVPFPTHWCRVCGWVDDAKLYKECDKCKDPICTACVRDGYTCCAEGACGVVLSSNPRKLCSAPTRVKVQLTRYNEEMFMCDACVRGWEQEFGLTALAKRVV